MPRKKKKYKIGVSPIIPMVVAQNEGFTGFEAEFFKLIAKEAKLDYEFETYSLEHLIKTVSKGEVDMGFSAITVSEEREKMVDFSHHTLDTGLSIIVPLKAKRNLFSSFKHIFEHDIFPIFFLVFGFILFSAHAIWLAEFGAGTFGDTYFPGIFDAIWWAVVTVGAVGYGDIVPVTWAGKLVSIFIILIGLGIVGFYIARITSLLTIKEIESDIKDETDLQAKVVATVKTSTSVQALHDIGAIIVETNTIEEAYDLLYKRDVQAVVFDSPVLMHYTNTIGRDKARIVGEMFNLQSYAFAFPEDSELLETVNQMILRIKDNGEYQRLYSAWFGKKPDQI